MLEARAQGGYDALWGLRMDVAQHVRFFGLVKQSCWELHANGVRFGAGPPVFDAAVAPETPSSLPAAEPEVVEPVIDPVPATRHLYATLGWDTGATTWSSDTDVVRGFLAEGRTEEELVAAVMLGVKVLGKEQPLEVLLAVGLASAR